MNGSVCSPALAGGLVAWALVAPLASSASDIVVSVPGNTVVQDAGNDLMLLHCDLAFPDRACSLPPGGPDALPAWADVKTAKITAIGGGRVDLQIALYAPAPADPGVPFFSYFWQFQDGCVEPSPTDKDGIRVHWDGAAWNANWYVITSCNPRHIVQGDPVDFVFTDDGVRVRVSLEDLLTRGGGVPMTFYAGTRRLPFEHPVFTRTIPVDVAPDVNQLNPSPPPILIHPQVPAPWQP